MIAQTINKAALWFTKTALWKWFAMNVMGRFTFRWFGYPGFDMNYFKAIEDAIFKARIKNRYCAQVFVSKDKKSFTGKVISLFSEWAHAGVFDQHYHQRIIHVIGKGTTKDHVLNLLKEVDNFAVINYEFDSAQKRDLFYARVNTALKNRVPYDFQTKIDFDKLYCSELIWYAGHDTVSSKKFKLSEVMDRKTFMPDNVYWSGEIIFEYRKKCHDK